MNLFCASSGPRSLLCSLVAGAALALLAVGFSACAADSGDGPLSGLFGPSSGTCSSGLQWNGGSSESAQMTPGGNCITCHRSSGEGPGYSIAGTVMGAIDDKDNCSGVSGMIIEITDSNGATTTMTSNTAGNFFSSRSVSTPYTAKIIDADGNERAMLGPQTNLNCATCHTQVGTSGAPGRVFAP